MSTIADRFTGDDGARGPILERARKCAANTKPWLLPPVGQQATGKLPQSFQSLGARILTNLEGRTLGATFPADLPWFQLVPASSVRYDQSVSPAALQQIEQALYLYELIIQQKLEATELGEQYHTGFRTAQRQSLSQILCTGDSLEYLDNDYRLRVFRRDQYTTKRDSSGDVIYHDVKEQKDPLGLTDRQLERAGLKRADLEGKRANDRFVDLFTSVDYQPVTRRWLVRQEVEGKTILESDEGKISPYFCTPFELVAGEDYGRGFIEQLLPDLNSYDQLSQRILEFAYINSRCLLFKDLGCEIRNEDFEKPTGGVVEGARVVGGVIQDFAFGKVDKSGDFAVVYQTLDRLGKVLASAGLLEAESVRPSERTTAYEVQAVTIRAIEGALGGFYAPVADRKQTTLLNRAIFMCQRDGLLPPLPRGTVELRILTGLAALSREAAGERLKGLIASIVGIAGPEGLRYFNIDVLIDVMLRYSNVFEPGVVKSKEQLAAEIRQQIATQTALAAGQKAVDVTGNIAQHAATQPQQGQLNAGS